MTDLGAIFSHRTLSDDPAFDVSEEGDQARAEQPGDRRSSLRRTGAPAATRSTASDASLRPEHALVLERGPALLVNLPARRAWFASRRTAQASATGPTCPSLSGLITARIVWICPSRTSSVQVSSLAVPVRGRSRRAGRSPRAAPRRTPIRTNGGRSGKYPGHVLGADDASGPLRPCRRRRRLSEHQQREALRSPSTSPSLKASKNRSASSSRSLRSASNRGLPASCAAAPAPRAAGTPPPIAPPPTRSRRN